MIKKIFKGFTTAIIAAFLAVLSNSALSLIANVLGYGTALSSLLTNQGWLNLILLMGLFVIWTIILFKEKVIEKKED